jgi:hypothetical protein
MLHGEQGDFLSIDLQAIGVVPPIMASILVIFPRPSKLEMTDIHGYHVATNNVLIFLLN